MIIVIFFVFKGSSTNNELKTKGEPMKKPKKRTQKYKNNPIYGWASLKLRKKLL